MRYAAALAVAATVMVPSAAAAAPLEFGQSVTFTYSGFGSTPDDTCSVCTALATFTLVDSNTIRIELENTSTYAIGDTDGGNIIGQLLVLTDPNIEYAAGTANFFGTTGWAISSTGVGQWTFEADTSGSTNALQPGATLTVEFDVVGALTTLEIVDSQVHWQQTGLNNEDSDKGGPGAPIPEPGSMLLLGSGLMFAARAYRRRQAA